MLLLAALAPCAICTPNPKPNIFFVLADDYGWGNAGWHNDVETAGQREVQTPHMEALIAEGIELNQHYVRSPHNSPRLA